MGTVLRDLQGRDHTVFDRDDAFKLVEELAGTEVCEYLKESIEDVTELEDQIDYLLSELDVMRQKCEQLKKEAKT